MVHSYTALRTLIRNQYGLKALKAEEGLFVSGLHMSDISEEHKLCYSCEERNNGVLFKLPNAAPQARVLPATKDNFLLRCVRSNYIDVIEQKLLRDTSIELTASNDPILRTPNVGFGSYMVYTIRIQGSTEFAQRLLSKCSYEQSSKDAQLYRVYFRLGSRREPETWDRQDVADLIELLVKSPDDDTAKWKGMSLEEVKELVRKGSTEVLFGEEAKELVSKEESCW